MPKTDERGELIGYMENGGFVGIEDHQVIAEPLKVSVNKPLTGLPTEHSQRIHGERIEIWKKKMGAHINPNGEMSATKKEWKGVQKPLKAEAGDISTPSRSYREPESYEAPEQPKYASQADSPLGQMKNHLDQVHGWVKIVAVGTAIALLMGAWALGAIYHP